MTHQTTPLAPSFALRLFTADDSLDDGSDTPFSPLMTLPQFFERWYRPIVLGSQKSASSGTETIYRNALHWWAELTGDPPLRSIDEFTVATFCEGLKNATYRRGVGAERKLAKPTIAKHLRQIRALLHRAGPNIDAKRPSKSLMKAVPLVTVPRVESTPKGCFSLEQATAISAAAEQMTVPKIVRTSPANWWRAYIAWLFVTGLREGTLRRLQWSMIREAHDGWWLDVPSELVPKTHKAISMALPDWSLELLRLLPSRGEIFAQPHHRDWLKRLHKRLQALAGIERPLSFQGWRRTHGRQMAELGLGFATEVARRALDHGDVRTTTSHYVSLENDLRRRLPNPFVSTAHRQLQLF